MARVRNKHVVLSATRTLKCESATTLDSNRSLDTNDSKRSVKLALVLRSLITTKMDPAAKIISINYGNSVLNNRDAVRKVTASQMELPKQEQRNSSFATEWQDFVGDFPQAETYLHTDFVDRVFPSFKECVLTKEYTDSESVSDASSDDGNSQFGGTRSPVSKEDGEIVPIIKLPKS